MYYLMNSQFLAPKFSKIRAFYAEWFFLMDTEFLSIFHFCVISYPKWIYFVVTITVSQLSFWFMINFSIIIDICYSKKIKLLSKFMYSLQTYLLFFRRSFRNNYQFRMIITNSPHWSSTQFMFLNCSPWDPSCISHRNIP